MAHIDPSHDQLKKAAMIQRGTDQKWELDVYFNDPESPEENEISFIRRYSFNVVPSKGDLLRVDLNGKEQFYEIVNACFKEEDVGGVPTLRIDLVAAVKVSRSRDEHGLYPRV